MNKRLRDDGEDEVFPSKVRFLKIIVSALLMRLLMSLSKFQGIPDAFYFVNLNNI